MQDEIRNIRNQALGQIISAKSKEDIENIKVAYLGRNGYLTKAMKQIKDVSPEEKKQVGSMLNDAKQAIANALEEKFSTTNTTQNKTINDTTIPGIKPDYGSLHLITYAINEISEIFEKIGFVRRRYPEVEWDWYSFEALNFPLEHPARDNWETFWVNAKPHEKYGKMLLTPHTSNGQVREMKRIISENKGFVPVRMINISKTYRRQSDASHYPMFHQFEGLVIDEGISLSHLKGTIEYFIHNYYSSDRQIRFRPHNFPFTEPSFEIDIGCDICGGKGCRVCKEGWLELAGAGMVHPNVLKAGGVDPNKYSGFAFGAGVERFLMMKPDLKIPDLRMLYSSDLRYLKQF